MLLLDFASPKTLAQYLKHLNTHDEEYNTYLGHKINGELTNLQLIKTMEERSWEIDGSTEKGDFIENFSCFVCNKAINSSGVKPATTDHYSCPMPLSILTNEPNSSNFWLDVWFHGKCEAEVTRQFIDSGTDKILEDDYETVLHDLILNRKCNYIKDIKDI